MLPINMDNKTIIAAVVVVVVVIAAIAFVAMPKGSDDDPTVEKDYIELGLTNNFFPDHTCCVIAANYDFLNKNAEQMERFLAGYYEGVQFVLNALENESSEDYKWLVNFSKTKVPGLTDVETKDALADIAYLYADDNFGDLSELSKDIASLIGGLKEVGALTKDVADAEAFAGYYVDDSYLKYAIENKESLKGKSTVTLNVAVITGDIHQIAVHVAESKGYFNEYGIDVEFAPTTNGAGVVTSLLNGDSELGFMGAPPATINMVNNGYIDSTGVKDDKAYKLVSRVNSEGSGIFIDKNVLDNVNSAIPMRNGVQFYSVDGDEYVVSKENAKAWGGLVLGTPGTSSIQHIQILQLAKQLGLKTSMYTVGTTIEADTIYYVTNLAAFQQIITNEYINGGIIWEPQYQRVIQEA